MIDIHAIITSIEAEKKAKNLSPSHALFSEIMNEVSSQVKSELNQLVASGKVRWCETINSIGFETINT